MRQEWLSEVTLSLAEVRTMNKITRPLMLRRNHGRWADTRTLALGFRGRKVYDHPPHQGSTETETTDANSTSTPLIREGL